jgi:cytochrome c-type biogenesis protein
MDMSFMLAFSAGILSFLSPCVLPLVPVYLAIISGQAVGDSHQASGRLPLFFHSLAFVAGFSAIFIILGTGAGFIGMASGIDLVLLQKISGSMLIVFGALLLASRWISWLNYEKRLNVNTGTKVGYLRSAVIGALFAFGWTPCIGPVLGGILALAISSETAAQGSILLALYSLGLGIPFLVMGLAFDYLSPALSYVKRHSLVIQVVSGLLLIAAGIAMLTNSLAWFSSIGV